MAEVNKYGALIDTCLACGGMWLDKGELGAIMGQMRQAESSIDQELGANRNVRQEYAGRYHDGEHHEKDHHDKHKRKGSILDLFD
jgi:uncharacterized protein